jgi:hypothetical protein
MIHIFIFYGALLPSSIFAVWRGGTPEKIIGAILMCAAASTSMIPFRDGVTFTYVNWPALYIDLALLLILTAVAARADRYWPGWMAGLQLLTIGVHAVRAYDPHIVPIAYARIAGEISYPMLVILIIGTFRHHRRTLVTGPEAAWSRFHW